MTDNVEASWLWLDPACPFGNHCYCGNDGEAPPHEKLIKRPSIAVQKALAANADTIATLQAKLDKAVEGLERIVAHDISITMVDVMTYVERDIIEIAQSLIKELQ